MKELNIPAGTITFIDDCPVKFTAPTTVLVKDEDFIKYLGNKYVPWDRTFENALELDGGSHYFQLPSANSTTPEDFHW